MIQLMSHWMDAPASHGFVIFLACCLMILLACIVGYFASIAKEEPCR